MTLFPVEPTLNVSVPRTLNVWSARAAATQASTASVANPASRQTGGMARHAMPDTRWAGSTPSVFPIVARRLSVPLLGPHGTKRRVFAGTADTRGVMSAVRALGSLAL